MSMKMIRAAKAKATQLREAGVTPSTAGRMAAAAVDRSKKRKPHKCAPPFPSTLVASSRVPKLRLFRPGRISSRATAPGSAPSSPGQLTPIAERTNPQESVPPAFMRAAERARRRGPRRRGLPPRRRSESPTRGGAAPSSRAKQGTSAVRTLTRQNNPPLPSAQWHLILLMHAYSRKAEGSSAFPVQEKEPLHAKSCQLLLPPKSSSAMLS